MLAEPPALELCAASAEDAGAEASWAEELAREAWESAAGEPIVSVSQESARTMP